MKNKYGLIRLVLSITFSLTAVVGFPLGAEASDGLPGSPEFGYGTNISLSGEDPLFAIDQASQMSLDWVSIAFDWGHLWPDPNLQPDISVFSTLVQAAQQRNLSVMVSFRNAPAWAMTPEGPSPEFTASTVLFLLSSLSGQLPVIELFPGSNTFYGWGAPANPVKYLAVFQAVQSALANRNLNTIIIPSLSPFISPRESGDMDDLLFLETLYDTGAHIPIVGIRFTEIIGDPLSNPDPASPNVLRHYELVRQFMLQKGMDQNRIWITGFSWPKSISEMTGQAQWLSDAFRQLKAQLYIGAAFFAWLNLPGPEDTWGSTASLLQIGSNLHPAYLNLKLLASGSPPEDEEVPVYQPLVKKLVRAVNYKRHPG